MLRTWQLPRAMLTRSARSHTSSPQLRLSSGPGSQASDPDPPASDNFAQDEKSLSLRPVPDFIGAIFNPRPYPQHWQHDSISAYVTAERLDETISATPLRRFRAREIIHYNEILARSRQLGEKPTLSHILHGLRLAIHRPATMKTYLGLWYSQQKESSSSHYMKTLHTQVRRVLDALDTIDFGTMKRTDLKKAKQYFVVLGGRIRVQETGMYTAREQSLYHLISAHAPQLWEQYLRLVYKIGGPGPVYDEWRSYTSDESRKKNFREGSRNKDWMLLSPMARHLRYRYWNAVVRVLATDDSWELAWKVAYEHPDMEQHVQKETWVKLLAYPLGLKKWIPEKLPEPAMDMLVVEVGKLEKKLGISWRGGEHGYHVLDGEPFWVDDDMHEPKERAPTFERLPDPS